MTNEITTPLTFEQKMANKIKESIGDLLSDEDLTKLVNRGLEEAFFTERPNPHYHYNNNQPRTIEPLIHDIVRQTLQPAMNEAVKKYLEENQEHVMVLVNKTVQEGAGQALIKALDSMFSGTLISMQASIHNVLNQHK